MVAGAGSLCPRGAGLRLRAPRSVATRLNQIVLGHGFFGDYYRRFVPTEDTACPCGESPVQTIRHVLADCWLHDEARQALRRASSYFSLSALFNTKKGLAALIHFLSRSNAFAK
jgi:hypothetical protein